MMIFKIFGFDYGTKIGCLNKTHSLRFDEDDNPKATKDRPP